MAARLVRTKTQVISRFASSGQRNDFPILIYHDVAPAGTRGIPFSIAVDQLESHLDLLLQAGWTTVDFRTVLHQMSAGRSWPNRQVWITFDDGYTSFLERALPALRARKMTATIFIVAGEFGGFNRWDAEQRIPRRSLLQDEGLRTCAKAGIEVGSHGWAHRDLNSCSEAEVDEEIVRSRGELERRLGQSVTVFSYPYGRYSQSHFHRLAAAGYRGAVSEWSHARFVTDEVFAMRRISLQDGDTGPRFRMKLCPLYLRYRAWRGR
jgi:peptidoglycan/xylan/chitin deacetylase (PgdA/CDA1 family)